MKRTRGRLNSTCLAFAKRPEIATFSPIDQFNGHPRNPRRPVSKRVRQIAGILHSFGFSIAVLVGPYADLREGQQRLRAFKELSSTGRRITLRDRMTKGDRT